MSKWYCQIDGAQSGPYSLEDLQFLATRGQLSPEALVRQGTGQWCAAGALSEIFPSGWGPRRYTSAGVVESVVEDARLDVAEAEFTETSRPPVDSRNEDEQQDNTGIKAAVAAALIALLLLLLLLLLWNRPRGEDGMVVTAVADVGGQGQQEVGQSLGTDGDSGLVELEEPDGAQASDGEEIVYDGEITEASKNQPIVDGDPIPEEEVPPPGALFQVQQFAPPAAAQTGGGQSGGLGDFKDRVAREGGQNGEVQMTLIWDNVNDLDLHVICPSGEKIWYRHRQSRCGGKLDIDMNDGTHSSREPVENVFWEQGYSPDGRYRVLVEHFANRGAPDPTKFEVAITYQGTTKKFSGELTGGRTKRIHEFEKN